MAAEPTSWWTILDAIGSGLGGIGTIGAAAFAGRIAYLAEYGAKPYISRMGFGQAAVDRTKQQWRRTFGLTVTNRRKHEITVVEIYLDGFADLLDEAELRSDFDINTHSVDVGVLTLRCEKVIQAGEAFEFNFDFLALRKETDPTVQRWRVRLFEEHPFVRRYWISRIADWRDMKKFLANPLTPAE